MEPSISRNGNVGFLNLPNEEVIFIAKSSDELDAWAYAASVEHNINLESESASASARPSYYANMGVGGNTGFNETSRRHGAPEKGRVYKIVAGNVSVEGTFEAEKKYAVTRENKMINSRVIITRKASEAELVRKQGIYPVRRMRFKKFNSAAEAFIQNFDRVRVDKEDYKSVASYCVRLIKFFENVDSLPISLAPKLSGMLGQAVNVSVGQRTLKGQLMALHYGTKADVLIEGNLKEVRKEDVWI